MSESEILDSLATGLPVMQPVANSTVVPGLIPANSINSTNLMTELPYTATNVARPAIKSTSFSDSMLTFNHTVNLQDLISRGVSFSIPDLVLQCEVEAALIMDDGSTPTALSGQSKTDFEANYRDLQINRAKIGLKNFASCIETVVCDLGSDLNFTISNCSELNSVLPFFTDEKDHLYNAPLYKNRGFQHSSDLTNDLIINSGTDDYFDFGSSTSGIYNPFSKDGAFAQKTTASGVTDMRDMLSEGIVDGKLLKAEQTGSAV